MKYWDEEHVELLDFRQGEITLPTGRYPARRGLLVEYGVPQKLIEVEIIPNSEQDADISNMLTGDIVRMYCVMIETRVRGMEANAHWRTHQELVPFTSLRLTSIPKGWKEDPKDAYERAMSIL